MNTECCEGPKRLLVLGNGFDLDLGYKTGYMDFFGNDNPEGEGRFPFVEKGKDYHVLGKYLVKCKTVKEWNGLENVLAEYGRVDPSKDFKRLFDGLTSKGGVVYSVGNLLNRIFGKLGKKQSARKSARDDHGDYNRLAESLRAYLASVELGRPRAGSAAARLLKAVGAARPAARVFSFNHTDFEEIARALGVPVAAPVYVHGNAKDGDMVLGVGDYVELRPNAQYLYKTSNANYHSRNMFEALDSSDEVYIFGLSLSQGDYAYFEDFFSKIASGSYGPSRKFVRIFTYDDASRSAILSNLRKMNKGLIKLDGYADFDVLRTKDDIDESKFLHLLSRLQSPSA